MKKRTAPKKQTRAKKRLSSAKPRKRRKLPSKGRPDQRVHVAFDTGLTVAPHFSTDTNLVEQGRTTNFVVSYDPSLGDAGPVISGYLLQACEYDYSRAAALFGVQPASLPFNISIVYSSAGAWHDAPCENTSIGIGAITTNPPDALFLRSLMLSEVVEALSATLANGWRCNFSNGEALSRVLSDALAPCDKPHNFLTGYLWLDSPRVDWVNRTNQTDRDIYSTGCGVLFLNWLHFQLGFGWDRIIAAGGSTLSETYQNLTGQTDGFVQFRALLDAKFPLGVMTGLRTDNVFPIA